jgi:hypothetical protein
MKAPFLALLALSAASSTGVAQTLFDDFNDSAIDSTKWTTSAFGSGSITESGGFLNFSERGRVTSVADFPVGLTLEGRFSISGAVYDQFTLVLRTDGTFNNSFGESANGIFVRFNSSQNPDNFPEISISNIDGSADYTVELQTTLNANSLYDFKIVDTGSSVSVFLGDLVNPALNASTSVRAGNEFSIYNRELSGNLSKLDFISATATPEPTSVALLIVGSILLLRRPNVRGSREASYR